MEARISRLEEQVEALTERLEEHWELSNGIYIAMQHVERALQNIHDMFGHVFTVLTYLAQKKKD